MTCGDPLCMALPIEGHKTQDYSPAHSGILYSEQGNFKSRAHGAKVYVLPHSPPRSTQPVCRTSGIPKALFNDLMTKFTLLVFRFRLTTYTDPSFEQPPFTTKI
jgi:hypothetical protein